MSLARHTTQMLCRLLLVAWVFMCVVAAIEGCFAPSADSPDSFARYSSKVSMAIAGHDHSVEGKQAVCKNYCNNTNVSFSKIEQPGSSFSPSVLVFLPWVMMPLLVLGVFSSIQAGCRRSSVSSSNPPYLLFHRFNN